MIFKRGAVEHIQPLSTILTQVVYITIEYKNLSIRFIANDFNYLDDLCFRIFFRLFSTFSPLLWLSLNKNRSYRFPNEGLVILSRTFLLKATGF